MNECDWTTLPLGGRHRRHRRRAGWAKRAAARVAVGQNKGKYWCEFGELMTPKLAAAFGGQQPRGHQGPPTGPAGSAGDEGSNGGGDGGIGGGGGVAGGGVGGGVAGSGVGGVGVAGATGTPVGGYKKAGWIPPESSPNGGAPGSSASSPAPPPMGSLVLALTSLSLRL